MIIIIGALAILLKMLGIFCAYKLILSGKIFIGLCFLFAVLLFTGDINLTTREDD